MNTLNARIQHKRDTSQNWTAANPVLLEGEIIIVDTNAGEKRTKTGDGKKKYSELPFDDEVIKDLVNRKAEFPEGGAADQVLMKTADGEAWGYANAVAEKATQKPISFQVTGLEGESFTIEFTEDGEGGDVVTSFNGRFGSVTPQAGDYTADMVGARPSSWIPSAAETGAIPASEKGSPSGVATLDETGKVPAGQLPAMNYDPTGSAQTVQGNLNAHTSDANSHVTAGEKTAWNGKAAGNHTHTAQQVGAAPASHTHSVNQVAGVFPISQGGTGVSSMEGTDYTTYRPRGIALMSSVPSSIPNGCIVGIYEQ